MGLILGIVALVAAGCIVAYAVIVTAKWIKNKIKDKIRQRNAKKVAVADIEQLINQCDNQVSIDELDSLVDEGYDYLVASVDDSGNVDDVEVVKDTSDYSDSEVDKLLGKKGMIVVNS